MPANSGKKAVRAATLADVGREAGVSAMAASVVLNGAQTSSRIAPETRKRILQAAKLLNYRPNVAARALAERNMRTLGVATLFDEGGELNQYFLELFNGILAGATHAGQNITVFALHDWERDAGDVARFCDGRIDGLILLAPTMSAAATQNLPEHTPFVSVHSNINIPGAPNIETDEEDAADVITTHLITQGHRRIAHLAGPSEYLGAQRRLAGYKRALAKAKIRFDKNLVIDAGFSTAEGRRAFKQWMSRRPAPALPDAIMAVNDGTAIGCIQTLAESGLRVPGDISVTGFDDSLAARTSIPQLTTMRQPLRAMGVSAVETLLKRVHAKRGRPAGQKEIGIVFHCELVERASVAAKAGRSLRLGR